MFSSNQLLTVTGSLDLIELCTTLTFALNLSNKMDCFTRLENPAKCVYQITDDGRYCIGWAIDGVQEEWYEYPFNFSLKIISEIILQHLNTQEIEKDIWGGSYSKGFIMKVIPETMSYEYNGIKNPFYGIVEFSPYTCFYSK